MCLHINEKARLKMNLNLHEFLMNAEVPHKYKQLLLSS